MTGRGGSPQEVGEVLARARRCAGVDHVPHLDGASAPPQLGEAGEAGRENPAPTPSRSAVGGGHARPEPSGSAAGYVAEPQLDPAGAPASSPRPLHPRHDGTFCKSCGKRILWAQLLDEAGERQRKPDGHFKAIPVDFDPVPNGNVVLYERPGQGIVCTVLRRGEIPSGGVRLRVSHFATCPNAKQHRRSR